MDNLSDKKANGQKYGDKGVQDKKSKRKSKLQTYHKSCRHL